MVCRARGIASNRCQAQLGRKTEAWQWCGIMGPVTGPRDIAGDETTTCTLKPHVPCRGNVERSRRQYQLEPISQTESMAEDELRYHRAISLPLWQLTAKLAHRLNRF